MAEQQITEARALQHLLRCPDWSGMKMFAAVPLSSVVHKTLQHVSLDDYKEDSPVLTGSIPQALPFLEMHWPSLQSRTNSCCQSCTGLLVTHFSTCFQHNFENSKSKISPKLWMLNCYKTIGVIEDPRTGMEWPSGVIRFPLYCLKQSPLI